MPERLNDLRTRLLTLPRNVKQAALMITDALASLTAAILGIYLVLNKLSPALDVIIICVASAAITLASGWYYGLYRSIVRYIGSDLVFAGFKTTGVSAALTGGLIFGLGLGVSPLRWAIVYLTLSLLFLVTGRDFARRFLNRRNRDREEVIVYGAGEAGANLVTALFAGDDYIPVAVVDDMPALEGKRIHGLEVCLFDKIEEILEDTKATGVLLAVPSASRFRRRQILEKLAPYPLHVQIMPDLKDLISGKARVDDLREVSVKDILGRDTVPPHEELLSACIANKSVMVTGAGGSIGSELCRQIFELRPRRLILFEISEPQLYSVSQELQKASRKVENAPEIVPLLGNVLNQRRVRETLEMFDVDTVYHAAAYKHVPIVENNILEGIENNVLGTLSTAKAAIEAHVEHFVLVSTDKAVNPTSAMGATKRLAELVLQGLNSDQTETMCCMVRFGNVLESSGSVVPLFREQIRNGGPVTVTHRDIIRYFMTIPEAAQLVLQAGSMAKGGDVFVLDMGEPVRIEDLARRMINLMGLTVRDENNPDGDIEIDYIGLRPAEKLFEELLIGTNATGTKHPRIMRADEFHWAINVLMEMLADLGRAIDTGDRKLAKQVLHQAVQEYDPSGGITDLVWKAQQESGKQPEETVVDFPSKA